MAERKKTQAEREVEWLAIDRESLESELTALRTKRDELARKLAESEKMAGTLGALVEKLTSDLSRCQVDKSDALIERDRFKAALKQIAGETAHDGPALRWVARSALSPSPTVERFGAEIKKVVRNGGFYTVYTAGEEFVLQDGQWYRATAPQSTREIGDYETESAARAALATATDPNPKAPEQCGCGCRHCPSKSTKGA